MKYFILAFKKIIDIDGKTSRKEYWMFILFHYLILLGLLTLILPTLYFIVPLVWIYSLTSLVTLITATMRRLRDAKYHPLLVLLIFGGPIGWVVLLILTLQKSKRDMKKGILVD